MLLWFLARDEERSRGWQSGFLSASGLRKPSFYAFQTLARASHKQQLSITRSLRRTRTKGLKDLLRGAVGGDERPHRSWLPVGPLLAGP
jgi:hypothetical protein